MPFDLGSHFTKLTNLVANKSLIGQILTNPLWISVVITGVLLLIIYQIGWDGHPTFKLLFYMFSVCFGLIIIHDGLLNEQILETVETSSGESFVNDITTDDYIDTKYEVKPRDVAVATKSFNRFHDSGPIDFHKINDADGLNDLIDSN